MEVIASHPSAKNTGNIGGKFCLIGLDTFDFGVSKREIHRLPRIDFEAPLQ
jgi:hypothetical protein